MYEVDLLQFETVIFNLRVLFYYLRTLLLWYSITWGLRPDWLLFRLGIGYFIFTVLAVVEYQLGLWGSIRFSKRTCTRVMVLMGQVTFILVTLLSTSVCLCTSFLSFCDLWFCLFRLFLPFFLIWPMMPTEYLASIITLDSSSFYRCRS